MAIDDMKHQFSYDTEVTRQGAYVTRPADHPEAIPIYLTTAFNVPDTDALLARYDAKGFCYNRSSNPNRISLAELMTYLEQGEDSLICSSGMAAITTSLLSNVQSGDHILSDHTLYGETLVVFSRIMKKFGVEYTCVDMTNLEEVRANIKPNTRILYSETATNPTIRVADIKGLADIAHANGALLIIDNTFLTSYAVRPIALGADIVVNSLTKFGNDHSDAVCGSITSTAEMIRNCNSYLQLLGSVADAFTCYMTERGLRTLTLRMEKQMANAEKLAAALAANPHIAKVNHPSLADHPQHALAKSQFNGRYGAMMSFEVKEDNMDKLNAFMRKLEFVHYAMTLGGFRTTYQHPCSSSHHGFTPEEQALMGVSPRMIRVSCGIEDADDLIHDFTQALTVFD